MDTECKPITGRRLETVESVIGEKFGRLTVVSPSHVKDQITYVNCKCDCGKEVVRNLYYIRSLRRFIPTCSVSCPLIEKQPHELRKKRVEDYIGREFSALTILSFSHVQSGKTFVKCKCKCGRETTKDFYSVQVGTTATCGICSLAERRYTKLAGKVYGDLTVLSYSHTTEWNRNYLNVRCSCGNEFKCDQSKLHTPHYQRCKSCRSMQTVLTGSKRNKDRAEYEKGKVYGLLTVLGFSHGHYRVYYNYRCACGNTVVRNRNQVVKGVYTDCGCASLTKRQLEIQRQEDRYILTDDCLHITEDTHLIDGFSI